MVHAPADWKAKAPRPLPGVTFSLQDELPKLPVPDLTATLTKLEKSLRPLAQSPEELEVARSKIRTLGEEGGLGQTLHKRLIARANEPGRVNWLEELWDDAAYLTYRDSVVVNVSYYYGFEDHPPHLPQTSTHRAAALTRAALLFRRDFKQGKVKPDRVKDGGHCMDSWRWMFDCARVPGLGQKDFSVTSAQEGDPGETGTVIFLRKGRVWKVDASVDGRLISTSELESQIQHIYDNTLINSPPVGVLTANNRDEWAKDYDLLSESQRNVNILKEIHGSVFVVCLDSEQPETLEDLSEACWHGGVEGAELGNRWVDKPVQFVVWDNAKAGIMGEHSVMDGTPTARMSGELLDALRQPSFDHGPSTSSSVVPKPTALDWELNPTISARITSAQAAANSLVSSQALSVLRTSYGKAQIKTFGFSPDSWTQMIMQLAYYRLMGNKRPNGGTYEAATTRKFQRGRTEAIRVTSEESVKWCESMVDPNVKAEDKKALFKKACAAHGEYAREAGNGLGCDRHMFGLRNMLKEGESKPEIFTDPLFVRSSTWVLSTSAIYNPRFTTYGWGEVVPNGFGLPYVAGFDDFLQFTITSRKEMPNEKMKEELERAANDLKALFDDSERSKL